MAHHIRRSLFFSSSREFMTNLVILVAGVNPQNITYPQFMSICNSTNGIKHLIDM